MGTGDLNSGHHASTVSILIHWVMSPLHEDLHSHPCSHTYLVCLCEWGCLCARIHALVEVRGHPWVLLFRKMSSLLFMFIYVTFILVCTCVCMCVCNTMCVWRLEDKLQELVSPSIIWSPGTEPIASGWTAHWPTETSHLPYLIFFWYMDFHVWRIHNYRHNCNYKR